MEKNIIIYPIIKTEIDLTEAFNNLTSQVKKIAYSLSMQKENIIYKSSLDYKLLFLSDKEAILEVLLEVGIIESVSYNSYKILVKNTNDVDIRFNKTSLSPIPKYTYSQEIEHKVFKEKQSFSSESSLSLKQLIKDQIEEWEHRWKLFSPEYYLEKFLNVLDHTVKIKFSIDNFIDKSKYNKEIPVKPKYYLSSIAKPTPPKKTFWGINKKILSKYNTEKELWLKDIEAVEEKNIKLKNKYEKEISDWSFKFDEFIENQKKYNIKVEKIFEGYEKFSQDSSIDIYFEFILNNFFEYPYNNEFKVEYDNVSRTLKINSELPPIDQFPAIKEVTFVKSKLEYREKLFNKKEIEAYYSESVYKFILSILHIVSQSDYKHIIEFINVNHWVNFLNKALGRYEIHFVSSILISTIEFKEVNLSLVDAKEFFRNFKGLATKNFSDITPIKPVLTLNTDDSRFIDAINIVDSLSESTNLASMDWEDFEYLIRELFEKEFGEGEINEVKITQASKDGGVDAIAFDKDPIRGGKIVIQAKRYTNVVSVSAVRDLYGTVMNEGANKGILVTTSSFGTESYNFAKDKPITLLNGQELLYLLDKHGYKARIDIEEAKKILKETKNKR